MRRMHLWLCGNSTMCGRSLARVEHHTNSAEDFKAHESGDRCASCERALESRNPYAENAGHVYSTRSGRGGGWVTIYKPGEQQIDVGGDRYAIVCQSHATLTSDNWITGAKVAAKSPTDWCEECRR